MYCDFRFQLYLSLISNSLQVVRLLHYFIFTTFEKEHLLRLIFIFNHICVGISWDYKTTDYYRVSFTSLIDTEYHTFSKNFNYSSHSYTAWMLSVYDNSTHVKLFCLILFIVLSTYYQWKIIVLCFCCTFKHLVRKFWEISWIGHQNVVAVVFFD